MDTVILGGPLAFAAVGALAVLAGDRGARQLIRPPVHPEAWAELIGSGRPVVPVDVVTAAERQPEELRTCASVPPVSQAGDIGHRSAARHGQILSRAGTVFWDGLMGDRCSAGTRAVAEAVAGSSAFTVINGADTVDTVERLGLTAFVDHVSTGGAASLELLRPDDLARIRARRDAPTRAAQAG